MKNLYFSTLTVLLSCLSLFAQNTITLNSAKDAMIIKRSDIISYADSNYGSRRSFDAMAWTWNGEPGLVRSLMEFNLTELPAGASISSATLSLYNDPTSAENNGNHASLSGSNEALLQRVVSQWEEYGVTWNNQPATTEVNQVTLHQSLDEHEDYTNIDVTALIIDMAKTPGSNNGLLIKIKTEEYYRCMIFASRDNKNENLRPKLKITYTLGNKLILKTNKDAWVIKRSDDYSYQTKNYGTRPSFGAMAWTWNSGPGLVRSFIEFDLTQIPAHAIITKADLSLYNDPTSAENKGEHSSLSGSNESVLQRIISPWNEDSVTWNTQPLSTEDNQITLHQSNSVHEDYLNIDVKSLVSDIVKAPSNSFGFLLKIKTESYYRNIVFASSDNANPDKHPTLDVEYFLPEIKDTIWGCIDPKATNYDVNANISNGHCLYKDSVIIRPGCTDPLAVNFEPFANQDNGTCVKVTPVIKDTTTNNHPIKDTVSVRPITLCNFDFSKNIDSAKIVNLHILPGLDSSFVTWKIYQGNKVLTLKVKYLILSNGKTLFILTIRCGLTGKTDAAFNAITLGEIRNVENVTGISTIKESSDITLYPNPAGNEINIKSYDKTINNIVIYSALGQEVYSHTSLVNTINISKFNSGVYFLKAYSAKGIITKRFIKQ